MIKFEEHDDRLFRMLEEPTPLTPDAEMPCLVRLIQNDSPMGKHNKDLHGFDQERLTPKICTKVIDVNDLSDPHRGIAYCDGFMSIQYYRYELIGTLVTEGSEDWALYQMMQGNRVTKSHLSHTYWQYDARPNLKCISEYNCGTLQIRVLPEIWLTTAEPTGWKIYTEPEPQYKVGDWVEYRLHANGDNMMGQITYINRIGDTIEVLPVGNYEPNSSLSTYHVIYASRIIRKLSHSEVVVPITISGTVRQAYNEDGTIDDEQFQLLPNGSWGGTEMFISFGALDTHTRKLVESLLKAQEEEE